MNHHRIVLPSEQFIWTMEVIAHISLLFLIATYFILLWVCLTKSPAPMSGYKWWLIINGTVSLLFEIFFAMTMPIVLLPFPILFLDGYLVRNGIFSDSAMELYADVFFDSIALVGFVITAMFLFRYCQTTGNLLYKIVFSSGKISVLSSFIVMGLIALLISIPGHIILMPRQMLLDDLNESDWTVYEQMKTKNILGTTTKFSDFTLTFFATLYVGMALTASVVITFSLISSYRFLRLNQNKFSRKTKELYLALLHSLTFDAILGIILVMCPVFAIILATFTSPYTPLIAIIGIRIVSFYQIMINVILFYVVKPYRKAIAQKCKQMFLFSRNMTLKLNITSVSSM